MVNSVPSSPTAIVVEPIAVARAQKAMPWTAAITFPAPGAGECANEWAEVLAGLARGGYIAAVCDALRYPFIAAAVEDAGAEIRDSIALPSSTSFLDSRFVILARAPMAGTVAETLLQHGTGAINIRNSRIGIPDSDSVTFDEATGTGRSGQTEDTGETNQGRWPTNLILSHTPDCRPAGTKIVKGITGTSAGRMAGKSSDVYGSYRGDPTKAGERTGFADADGNETVESWNCAPGCGVFALDEQSGELKSGTPGTMRLGENRSAAYGAESRAPGTPMTGYGDSGGASRFFPACHDLTAVSSWLHTLLIADSGQVIDPWADNAPCVPDHPGTMLCSTEQAAAALRERRATPRPEPVAGEPSGERPDAPLTLFEASP